MPGQQRPAMPCEMAQVCICTPMGAEKSVWDCYGPSPSAPKPQATCNSTTVNPGTGQGSCYVSWQDCSDGHVYAIDCVETSCECLVQGQVTELLAPSSTCPEKKSDLNMLCGWDLQ